MNLKDTLENSFKEVFSPIPTVKIPTPVTDAIKSSYKAIDDSVRATIYFWLDNLPTSKFEALLYNMRYTAINLVNDNDVVVFIEGITKKENKWEFSTVTGSGQRNKSIEDFTIDSQLVLMNHLEKLL